MRAPLLPILLLFLLMPLIAFSRAGSVGELGVWPAATLDGAFRRAIGASLLHGAGTALLTFLVGGLSAIVLALGDFRSRRALNVLWRSMLVVSPVIPAGGWLLFVGGRSDLFGRLVRGPSGAILAAAAMFSPIVMLAVENALAAAGRGAAEAALQSGGRRALFRWAAGVGLPAAIGGALIAGALAIGDATASEMFGVRGAASEVLVSLAARYDFREAAGQCLILSWIVAVALLPGLWPATKGIVQATLPGDTPAMPPFRTRLGKGPVVLVWTLSALLVGPPLSGIARHLFPAAPWGRAWRTILDTSAATLGMAGGGAVVAVAFGLAVALLLGRSKSLRFAVTPLAIAVLALPPSATAFGVRAIADTLPAPLANLMDHGGALVLAIAFRLWPVAFVLIARALGALPASFAEAAAVADVSPLRFGARILLVAIRKVLVAATAIIFLLGSSDVSSALLLGPPGRPTTLQSIYTTIANAREGHTAALFFLWILAAAAFWTAVEIGGMRRRK